MKKSSDFSPIVWCHNRVFVSPVSGCPARCRFCYLEESAHAIDKPTTDIPILIANIQSSAGFSIGKEGTLLSIGCLSEALAPHSFDATIEFLSLWPPSDNPIQLATRWVLDGEHLNRFLSSAVRQRLILCHSITSIARQSEFEPGTPSFSRRLKFMQACQGAGLRSFLYLKPLLPGITVADAERFVEICKNLDVSGAIVGPLYAPSKIRENLSGIDLDSPYFGIADNPVFGVNANEFGSTCADVATLRSYFEDAGISVFHHSHAAVRSLAIGKPND